MHDVIANNAQSYLILYAWLIHSKNIGHAKFN